MLPFMLSYVLAPRLCHRCLQRVHDPVLLTQRAVELGLPVDTIQSYIDSFKWVVRACHSRASCRLHRVPHSRSQISCPPRHHGVGTVCHRTAARAWAWSAWSCCSAGWTTFVRPPCSPAVSRIFPGNMHVTVQICSGEQTRAVVCSSATVAGCWYPMDPAGQLQPAS